MAAYIVFESGHTFGAPKCSPCIFRSVVSADPNLHDTTKLTLLKASVLGTKILDHLSCEGPNYWKVLNLLNNEFWTGKI